MSTQDDETKQPNLQWEQVGRVRYPIFDSPGLTTEEISTLIAEGRQSRIDDISADSNAQVSN